MYIIINPCRIQVIFILLLFLLTVATTPSFSYLYIRNATRKAVGSVIPWPSSASLYNLDRIPYLEINPSKFTIEPIGRVKECRIVSKAIERYLRLYFFEDVRNGGRDDDLGEKIKIDTIERLEVMSDPEQGFTCESVPNENMIESYQLDFRYRPPKLIAKTNWGLLRGLETFSQLIFYIKQEGTTHVFGVNDLGLINDEPRYKYRGFMLDTSRHYISLDNIKRNLDAMVTTKLNVFHWHMIDDQSFPFQSKVYPNLSVLSSYKPSQVYSQEDVKSIVDYAAERGIRVVPELDSPGHTYAMRHIKGFLTECYNPSTNTPNGDYGPVDPTKIVNYIPIAKLIREFNSLFPDNYFHAGGDEVDYQCWKFNPNIIDWMSSHNMTNNFQKLANYYIKKVHDIVAVAGKKFQVWQEVFDSGAKLPTKNTIVQVWKYRDDKLAYTNEMSNIVNAGYKAILSSCWYLNYIDYGQDWAQHYQCDPSAGISGNKYLESLVLGGEICMWSEFVDNTNVISRTWPRAAAAAERLWSPLSKNDPSEFLTRLEHFRCRLLARGIQAEPVNGPGYC